MSENYVVYYFRTTKTTGNMVYYRQHRIDPEQEAAVQRFLEQDPGKTPIASFVEMPVTQRHRQRWPELEKALATCREQNAVLIIAELRNLTNNDRFAEILLAFLDSGQEVHCCDQPLVNRDTFKALVEHARQHRKFHGQLIKQGLERSSAKSGNPNAKEVIDRVNRPKIENAIVFALLLQPTIEEYRLRGFSQRRMVNALNHEGIHAPEGGRWVLSQLQKVLERIKVNQAALAIEPHMETLALEETDELRCQWLQKKGIFPPKGLHWEKPLLQEVQERLHQLEDLSKMNTLLLELLPILQNTSEELSTELLMERLHQEEIIAIETAVEG